MAKQEVVIVAEGLDIASLEQAVSTLPVGQKFRFELYFLENLSSDQLTELRFAFEQAGAQVVSIIQQDDGVVSITVIPLATPSPATYVGLWPLIIVGAITAIGGFFGWQISKQVKQTVTGIPTIGWVAIATIGVVALGAVAILLFKKPAPAAPVYYETR